MASGTESWWTLICWVVLIGHVCCQEEVDTTQNDIEGTLEEESWFQIDEEDGELTVPELITKYGYRVETHAVISSDGYMLTVFRIAARQAAEKSQYPVLMVHGLFTSAADFVISGPNNSLAYMLADHGYEVWLANMRGTRYSKGHTSLKPDSPEYWDFSWHEMGYYDLPAIIDYIRATSGVSKVHYIGHSQGTTVYFVMSSTRAEYNEKIALATALSPAVLLKRIRSPVARLLLELVESLKQVLQALEVYDIFAYNKNYYQLAKSICPPDDKETICYRLISQLCGPNPEAYDRKLTLAFLGHAPAGASVKQLMHFIQLNRSGLFRQFDYGKKGNLQTYSNWKPPAYNLTASTAPVLIYYALNDWLVHPRDVLQTARKLPRLVAVTPVGDKKFNHLDFITARNAREQLYEKLVPVLDGFNDG